MLHKRIDDCGRAFWQNGVMTTVADARPAFAHVTDWVFDLDNTLYPRGCNLFAQIDLLISDYMVTVTGLPYAEARALQKAYYRDHGTTLHGLMLHHGVDPDHFLGPCTRSTIRAWTRIRGWRWPSMPCPAASSF